MEELDLNENQVRLIYSSLEDIYDMYPLGCKPLEYHVLVKYSPILEIGLARLIFDSRDAPIDIVTTEDGDEFYETWRAFYKLQEE